MLLSYVNMKLRDGAASPDELCEELGWERAELDARLAALGVCYDAAGNRYC